MLSLRLYLIFLDWWTRIAQVFAAFRDEIRTALRSVGIDGPPSPSCKVLTPGWLSAVLKKEVIAVERNELDENRGLAGSMMRYEVVLKDGTRIKTILKTSQPQRRRNLISSGQAREALFYKSRYGKNLAGQHGVRRVPRVYYSHGSTWLGEVVILMEDLTQEENGVHGIAVNHAMGNQVWGGVPEDLPELNRIELLKIIFLQAAELHAQHWNHPILLSEGWMRNSEWFSGRGRHHWELAMETSRRGWTKLKSRTDLSFPKGFVECIDASHCHSTWDKVQAHLASAPYTLCHGDFHAANMILRRSTKCTGCDTDKDNEWVTTVDWSEVGPWEPTTDLAQIVISDFPKELFAEVRSVLKAYWDALKSREIDYSWNDCLARFSESGMERWVWVLGAMGNFPLPSLLFQYFVDQMHAFQSEFDPERKSSHYTLKTCVYMLPTTY